MESATDTGTEINTGLPTADSPSTPNLNSQSQQSPEVIDDGQENNLAPTEDETQPESAGSNTRPLAELVKMGKDPETMSDITPQEWEELDKFYASNEPDLAKFLKSQGKASQSQDPKDGLDATKDPKGQEPKKKAGEETTPDVNDNLKILQEEVGAKSPEEALEKVKGLKARLHGKESDEMITLKAAHETVQKNWSSHVQLIQDFRAGNAAAIAHVKEHFGAVPIGQAPEPQSNKPDTKDGDWLVNKESFLDEDSAAEVNRVVTDLKNEVRAMKEERDAERKRAEADNQKREDEHIKTTAFSSTVDQMVKVRDLLQQDHPDATKELKGLPRSAMEEWLNGKDIPAMTRLAEIYQTAQDNNLQSLEAAYFLYKGKNADKLIADAKTETRKKVFDQKPNRSLSDKQTGAKTGKYQQFTQEDIERMTGDEGYKYIPDSWYDANGQLSRKNVPVRWQPKFFPK